MDYGGSDSWRVRHEHWRRDGAVDEWAVEEHLHRVIHAGSDYRVSVPFFFEPNFDACIRPLARCVEETGGKEIGGDAVYGKHLVGKIRGNFY